MVLERQDKEYNCAVYAVKFLMALHGQYAFGSDFLEQELGTTEENGTSHEAIYNWFNGDVISGYEGNIDTVTLPAIINYQFCDGEDCEGHYSVLLCVTEKKVTLYNPAYGQIEIIDKMVFVDNWYSKRYGNRWYLALK